jgi:superfamily II DNA or RNA helicase
MNIHDFLPKYPNIVKSDNEILNPYEDGFYESIFKKKEFYDERLDSIEELPDEKGMMMKHQKIIARFLSSHTMYDSLLLVHEMGCVDPSTPILLWSGETKKAIEIVIGDELIGDDGTPRKVLRLINGEADMFKINQHKADDYIVNGDHILTLQIYHNMSIGWTEKTLTWTLRWFDKKILKPKAKTKCCNIISKEDGYKYMIDYKNSIYEDNVIDITVKDYLKLSKTSKAFLKGYKCSGIQWPSKSVDIDPYLLGIWLGNGNYRGDGFTTADNEMVAYWDCWANKNNSIIKKVKNDQYGYYIRNKEIGLSPLKTLLCKYKLINNKHIPNEYIINDRNTRLKLLAGLIDTDGYVYNNGTCIEISQKNKLLSGQITYLCRSLGFSCQQKRENKYQILSIYGNNLEDIPILLPNKKINSRCQQKDPLVTNIIITPFGFGKYIGWEIGENRRFLLGDFTVTHNTGKTCSAIGAIEQIKNEVNNFKGALIFAKGQGLLQNFTKELRDKCTGGQYIPEGFVDNTIGGCGESRPEGGLTDLETVIRTRKLIEEFYTLKTFESFARHLNQTKDADITELYSNNVIVIDEVHNLRIQDVTEGDRVSMYTEFKRLLHLVKNCKILLLSGTPMKDGPEEIASVMNLILPVDLQFPIGEKFITKYLNQHGENKYTVKPKRVLALKKRFKGRVSFLKAIRSTVTKEFVGEKNFGKLKHLIVEPVTMSKLQTKSYKEADTLDKQGKAGVHYNARQASLMVFPDGSYGSVGFKKYVTEKTTTKTFVVKKLTKSGEQKKKEVKTTTYELGNELVNAIKGDTAKINLIKYKLDSDKYKEIIQKRLKNLRKYSVKYANIIESILNATDESCFVYSELVTGSGAIVFAYLLRTFGFSQSKGSDTKPGLRYGFLTSDITSSQIHKIINCFNQPENMDGKIIKVLIGSKVISEGVSFYNIQREYILTPWYNYSETDQAIARGYRLNSHKTLIKKGITPIVRISQLVAMPRKGDFSIDLNMYETSEDKDITIKGILRYMMESAFDCSLNYKRNHITGEDGQRGCDYQDCDYTCDGINMKNIEDGLPVEEIDNSTYELYYADPKVLSIRKDLEKYFRDHNELDINSIITYFNGKYTDWEIRNALKTIITKSGENMYYKDYVDIYSRSSVKKIMVKITDLFSTRFRINFPSIIEKFPDNTEFDVLTALKNIINESIVIKNRYGFSSYLREDQNIYFLVNNLSISNDSFSDYYAKVPNIVNDQTFLEILYDVQIERLPQFIKMICKITNYDKFSKLIKAVPEDVQELFIEAAVDARQKNIETNQITRNLVLDYFLNYIHDIDGVFVSNKLNDGENLRCYSNEKWEDCDGEYDRLIEEKLASRKNKLEQNPWGYYGLRNPETGVFSIVNVIGQQKKQEIVREKKLKELNNLVKKNKKTKKERDEEMSTFVAGREIYPGRNCSKGWGVSLLMKIAIKTLKLNFPADYKKNESELKMRKLVKDDKYLGKGTVKDPPIYTNEEINKLSNTDLKRSLYWSVKRTGGYIKGLCSEIEKWFENTKWKGMDMLIPDAQAGTSGGHVKIKKVEKKRNFRVEKIIPEANQERFKTYIKTIQKLMKECYSITKYIPEIDSKEWVIVYARKKLVGFLVLNGNKVDIVCIATNYKHQGIAQQAIQAAVEDHCQNKNPRITVNNLANDYKKRIKLYIEYGFSIIKNDGKYTIMDFQCK